MESVGPLSDFSIIQQTKSEEVLTTAKEDSFTVIDAEREQSRVDQITEDTQSGQSGCERSQMSYVEMQQLAKKLAVELSEERQRSQQLQLENRLLRLRATDSYSSTSLQSYSDTQPQSIDELQHLLFSSLHELQSTKQQLLDMQNTLVQLNALRSQSVQHSTAPPASLPAETQTEVQASDGAPTPDAQLEVSTPTEPIRLSCPICDDTFTTTEGLEQHVEDHLDSQEKVCPLCDHKFPANTEQEQYESHVHAHFGTYPRPDNEIGFKLSYIE